jgi:DNA polymerase III delta subunit
MTAQEQNSQYNESLYSQKTKQFASRLRKANLKNEEELNIIKTQFGEVQSQYLAELKSLKSDIKTIKRRGDGLSEQRVRESAMF